MVIWLYFVLLVAVPPLFYGLLLTVVYIWVRRNRRFGQLLSSLFRN